MPRCKNCRGVMPDKGKAWDMKLVRKFGTGTTYRNEEGKTVSLAGFGNRSPEMSDFKVIMFCCDKPTR